MGQLGERQLGRLSECALCTPSVYQVSLPPPDTGSEAAPPAHPHPAPFHCVTSTLTWPPKDHLRLLLLPIPCVLKNNQTKPHPYGESLPGALGEAGVEGRLECGQEFWGWGGGSCKTSVPFAAGRGTGEVTAKATGAYGTAHLKLPVPNSPSGVMAGGLVCVGGWWGRWGGRRWGGGEQSGYLEDVFVPGSLLGF